MITHGATTIWELWNFDTAAPDMNSQNHVMMLGDLLVWFYENLAGIRTDPAKPAFRRIVMNPDFPEGLDFVEASHHSVSRKNREQVAADEAQKNGMEYPDTGQLQRRGALPRSGEGKDHRIGTYRRGGRRKHQVSGHRKRQTGVRSAVRRI